MMPMELRNVIENIARIVILELDQTFSPSHQNAFHSAWVRRTDLSISDLLSTDKNLDRR
jgi:hypothetical protein